jgi:hypothetical protein
MGKHASSWVTALMVAALGIVFPKTAQADKTFKGENFAITFTTGWDTIQSASVIGKYQGLAGMVTQGATEGTALPNLDSLAAFYSDSLGGHITKDSSGTKTLGKYSVHWQQFKYDSLPKLSAQISASTGLTVNLKNGSFRVYFLQAEGHVFTLALLAILPNAIPPYADVETAIPTLKLGAQAGIISLARGVGRDLWIRGGKLGGAWLRTNRVFAVECFDTRGALIGSATHAPEGSWNLPSSRQEMFVVLRMADGTTEHFNVRPF